MNFLNFSKIYQPKLAFITQIFLCLSVFMMSANVWGQTDNVVVGVELQAIDTKGNDTIFNGVDEGLRITVSVTDNDPESQTYYYTIGVENQDITIGTALTEIKADDGTKIVASNWDGGGLTEGTYTLRVEIFARKTADEIIKDVTDTVSVTLDKTDPVISIGTDVDAFSPNRDRVLDDAVVFYSIDEDLVESRLEFLRKTGNTTVDIGQPDNLRRTAGNHSYIWDGGDRNRTFQDGEYILRFRAVDRAGNSTSVDSTDLTIDTVETYDISGGCE